MNISTARPPITPNWMDLPNDTYGNLVSIGKDGNYYWFDDEAEHFAAKFNYESNIQWIFPITAGPYEAPLQGPLPDYTRCASNIW